MSDRQHQGKRLPLSPQEGGFGPRLHGLMVKHKLGVRELAELVGVSPAAVTKWRQGAWPGGEYILRLVEVLQTDPTYLLSGLDETVGYPASRADAIVVAKAEIARAVRLALDEVLGAFEHADDANRPAAAIPPSTRASAGEGSRR